MSDFIWIIKYCNIGFFYWFDYYFRSFCGHVTWRHQISSHEGQLKIFPEIHRNFKNNNKISKNEKILLILIAIVGKSF